MGALGVAPALGPGLSATFGVGARSGVHAMDWTAKPAKNKLITARIPRSDNAGRETFPWIMRGWTFICELRSNLGRLGNVARRGERSRQCPVLRALVSVALAALPILAGGHAHAGEAHHLHWTGKVATGRTLVVDEPDGPHPLLTLPAWATIDELVVSPSREHALVYAQVHAGETRTVLVLDLVKRVVEGSYKPGFGGQFFFTANDDIFQYWGCGTQCAEMTVRSRTGAQLFQSTCAGFDETEEFSADRRFLACFGDDATVSVIDAERGKTLTHAALPCAAGHREGVAIDGKSGKVHFTCDDENEKTYDVTVSFGAVQNVSVRALR